MSSSFFHSVYFLSWSGSTGFSLAPLRIALSRSSRGLVGEAFSFEEIVGLDFEKVRFEDGFPFCIGDESSKKRARHNLPEHQQSRAEARC